MRISVTDAKAQLTDLVRQAEAGNEVILTRHGRPAVKLMPVTPVLTAAARRALLESVRGSASARSTAGPEAARSADFLYDENGLPR